MKAINSFLTLAEFMLFIRLIKRRMMSRRAQSEVDEKGEMET